MHTVTGVDALRVAVRRWRGAGEHVAFVPTMGNLHAGHMALVDEAKARGRRVVASVFVNPLQFAANEDYGAYPRTLEEDSANLSAAGVDLLFAPGVDEMYAGGYQNATRVEVTGLSDILCGAARPGHFVGVATVVAKLFNMVQPDVALFGEKDFQQLLVIRRMSMELCFPVQIVGVPTVREPDGLAMSSRNDYLSAQERQLAPALYRALCAARDGLRSGELSVAALETQGLQALAAAGMRPDYFSVRRADDLQAPEEGDPDLVVVAAAWLGRARLIDNIRVVR